MNINEVDRHSNQLGKRCASWSCLLLFWSVLFQNS